MSAQVIAGRSQGIHGGSFGDGSSASDILRFDPYGLDDPYGLYNDSLHSIRIPAGYSGRWLLEASVAWESSSSSGPGGGGTPVSHLSDRSHVNPTIATDEDEAAYAIEAFGLCMLTTIPTIHEGEYG